MVIKVMDFIVLVSILYPILDHTPSLSLPGWVDFLFAHEKNGNRESLNRSNFQLLALFCYCSNRSILIKCPPGNNRFQAGVMFGYRITMKLALKSKHLKINFFLFVLFIISQSVGFLSTPWQRSSHPISIESQFNPIPWILCIGTESTTFTILIQQ